MTKPLPSWLWGSYRYDLPDVAEATLGIAKAAKKRGHPDLALRADALNTRADQVGKRVARARKGSTKHGIREPRKQAIDAYDVLARQVELDAGSRRSATAGLSRAVDEDLVAVAKLHVLDAGEVWYTLGLLLDDVGEEPWKSLRARNAAIDDFLTDLQEAFDSLQEALSVESGESLTDLFAEVDEVREDFYAFVFGLWGRFGRKDPVLADLLAPVSTVSEQIRLEKKVHRAKKPADATASEGPEVEDAPAADPGAAGSPITT